MRNNDCIHVVVDGNYSKRWKELINNQWRCLWISSDAQGITWYCQVSSHLLILMKHDSHCIMWFTCLHLHVKWFVDQIHWICQGSLYVSLIDFSNKFLQGHHFSIVFLIFASQSPSNPSTTNSSWKTLCGLPEPETSETSLRQNTMLDHLLRSMIFILSARVE